VKRRQPVVEKFLLRRYNGENGVVTVKIPEKCPHTVMRFEE